MHVQLILSLAFILLTLTMPALAITIEPGQLDSSRSVALFKVFMRLPIKTEGKFNHVEGALIADPSDRWHVDVAVDVRQVTFSGPDWVSRVSLSEKFLDVENYPKIRFVSSPFKEKTLRDGGALRGKLTVRGQTRNVIFQLSPAKCESPGRGCVIEVTGTVNRRDFGMTSYRLTLRNNVEFEFQVLLAEL